MKDDKIKKENMIPLGNSSYVSSENIEYLRKYLKVPDPIDDNTPSQEFHKVPEGNSLKDIEDSFEQNNTIQPDNLLQGNSKIGSTDYIEKISENINKSSVEDTIESNNIISDSNKITDNSEYKDKFNIYVESISPNDESNRTYISPEFKYSLDSEFSLDLPNNKQQDNIEKEYLSREEDTKTLIPNQEEGRDYKNPENVFEESSVVDLISNQNSNEIIILNKVKDSEIISDDSLEKSLSLIEERNISSYNEKLSNNQNIGNTPNVSIKDVPNVEDKSYNKYFNSSSEDFYNQSRLGIINPDNKNSIELASQRLDDSYRKEIPNNISKDITGGEYSDNLEEKVSKEFESDFSQMSIKKGTSRSIPVSENKNVDISDSSNGARSSISNSILSKYIKSSSDTSPLPDHYSGNDIYIKISDWMGNVNDSVQKKIEAGQKYKNLMDTFSKGIIGDIAGNKAASYITSIFGQTGGFYKQIPPHSWGLLRSLGDMGLIRSGVDKLGTAAGSGFTKQQLLDQLLASAEELKYKSEKLLETNKDRLPGAPTTTVGKITSKIKGVKDAISNPLGTVTKLISGEGIFPKPEPVNRPSYKYNHKSGIILRDTPPGDIYDTGGLLRGGGSSTIVGSEEYSDGTYGIALTLKELCDKKSSSISSFEDLQNSIYESRLMTSWDKINKVGKFGLDSNENWEMVLKPYKGNLNGNYSFLPEFSEIRSNNIRLFGLNIGYDITGYSDCWLPINSFELQNRKLNQKSVGLYDGDFSVPVSMEFTNELRLSIVDDECKSFRRYFQTCSEVAVYNSYKLELSNFGNGRFDGANDYKTVTVVDKKQIAVATYKNLAFQCDIYIMKGDKSTVKKFSLLIVLRDFQEEYTGEIDGSSTELSLHFSIVGDLSLTDFDTLPGSVVEGTAIDNSTPSATGYNTKNSTTLKESKMDNVNTKNPSTSGASVVYPDGRKVRLYD